MRTCAAGRARAERRTDDGVDARRRGGRSRRADPPASPIVLLHGLTATRRYVVMGSRLLERSVSRDRLRRPRPRPLDPGARAPAAYGYERLARDLEAVLDALEHRPRRARRRLDGRAHALRFALDHPERVAALGLITPAFDPAVCPTVRERRPPPGADAPRAGAARGWGGGVRRAPMTSPRVPPALAGDRRDGPAPAALRPRAPRGVADALEVVSALAAVRGLRRARRIAVPDGRGRQPRRGRPGHPLAVAERYARAIPGATLMVEDRGPPPRSPIAWQGGQLSKVLAGAVCARRV